MGMQMRTQWRTPDMTHAATNMTHAAADKVDEARRRATAARDALAGRRAPIPWALLGTAAAIGAGVCWAIGSALRRSMRRMPVDTMVIDDEAAVVAGAPEPMSTRR